MIRFQKIGLLVLNEDATRFLVCEKAPDDMTTDYIMPGGQLKHASVEEYLTDEIAAELACEVDFDTLEYIGEYRDAASGDPENDVRIELFTAKLIGEPRPSTEIKVLHWIGREDETNARVSPIVRNKIIPDLIRRRILH